jgi:SAM-dependent methyltransferase
MSHSLVAEEVGMSATQAVSGKAAQHGELWGARARDWATNEEQQLPTYEEAIRRVGIRAGHSVLEVGCGSGVFLRAVADLGAAAHGIDASAALVGLARERAPEADVRVGDMQALPFEDDRFDVVAGFNSFFFADDIVAALREAGRVAKRGAPIVIQVWGPPDRCQLSAVKGAMAPFMPPPKAGAPAPPPLWQPGILEELAQHAGLTPDEAFDTSWAYEWPGDDELARSLLAPGLAVTAIRRAGEGPVRAAIVDAMAPYRRPDGGYHVENEWHYLVAHA